MSEAAPWQLQGYGAPNPQQGAGQVQFFDPSQVGVAPQKDVSASGGQPDQQHWQQQQQQNGWYQPGVVAPAGDGHQQYYGGQWQGQWGYNQWPQQPAQQWDQSQQQQQGAAVMDAFYGNEPSAQPAAQQPPVDESQMDDIPLDEPSTPTQATEDAKPTLMASNSFSNMPVQPSPFDDLSSAPSQEAAAAPPMYNPSMLNTSVASSASHSRQSSYGGANVKFIVGSESGSTDQSYNHSPASHGTPTAEQSSANAGNTDGHRIQQDMSNTWNWNNSGPAHQGDPSQQAGSGYPAAGAYGHQYPSQMPVGEHAPAGPVCQQPGRNTFDVPSSTSSTLTAMNGDHNEVGDGWDFGDDLDIPDEMTPPVAQEMHHDGGASAMNAGPNWPQPAAPPAETAAAQRPPSQSSVHSSHSTATPTHRPASQSSVHSSHSTGAAGHQLPQQSPYTPFAGAGVPSAFDAVGGHPPGPESPRSVSRQSSHSSTGVPPHTGHTPSSAPPPQGYTPSPAPSVGSTGGPPIGHTPSPAPSGGSRPNSQASNQGPPMMPPRGGSGAENPFRRGGPPQRHLPVAEVQENVAPPMVPGVSKEGAQTTPEAAQPAGGDAKMAAAAVSEADSHGLNIYTSPLQPHPDSPFQPPAKASSPGDSQPREVIGMDQQAAASPPQQGQGHPFQQGYPGQVPTAVPPSGDGSVPSMDASDTAQGHWPQMQPQNDTALPPQQNPSENSSATQNAAGGWFGASDHSSEDPFAQVGPASGSQPLGSLFDATPSFSHGYQQQSPHQHQVNQHEASQSGYHTQGAVPPMAPPHSDGAQGVQQGDAVHPQSLPIHDAYRPPASVEAQGSPPQQPGYHPSPPQQAGPGSQASPPHAGTVQQPQEGASLHSPPQSGAAPPPSMAHHTSLPQQAPLEAAQSTLQQSPPHTSMMDSGSNQAAENPPPQQSQYGHPEPSSPPQPAGHPPQNAPGAQSSPPDGYSHPQPPQSMPGPQGAPPQHGYHQPSPPQQAGPGAQVSPQQQGAYQQSPPQNPMHHAASSQASAFSPPQPHSTGPPSMPPHSTAFSAPQTHTDMKPSEGAFHSPPQYHTGPQGPAQHQPDFNQPPQMSTQQMASGQAGLHTGQATSSANSHPTGQYTTDSGMHGGMAASGAPGEMPYAGPRDSGHSDHLAGMHQPQGQPHMPAAGHPNMAAPMQQPNMAAPRQQPEMAAPMQQHNMAAPMQQPNTTAPMQQHNMAMPHQQPNMAGSMQQPNMADPMQQPNMAASMQQPNMAASMQQPNMAASMQQPNMAASMQQPNMAASVQQPNMSVPMQQPNMSAPMQQPNMSAPMQQPNMSAPMQQPNMAAPMQQPNMSAPMQQPNMSAPMQQPNMYAPMQQPDMSTPMQQPNMPQSSMPASTGQPGAPVQVQSGPPGGPEAAPSLHHPPRRDNTMSPATTLWQNPEPHQAGVMLQPPQQPVSQPQQPTAVAPGQSSSGGPAGDAVSPPHLAHPQPTPQHPSTQSQVPSSTSTEMPPPPNPSQPAKPKPPAQPIQRPGDPPPAGSCHDQRSRSMDERSQHSGSSGDRYDRYGRYERRDDYDRYDRCYSRDRRYDDRDYDPYYRSSSRGPRDEYDYYYRPRSRQSYEDPYRPRSRQGTDEDRPGSRQGYEDPYQRPSSRASNTEGSGSRPPSRQGEMERPRSRAEYDRERPRSRAEYDYYDRRYSDYRDSYGRRDYYDRDYYDRDYYREYEDYYRRQDRYNRGYYEEMQSYTQHAQQQGDNRYSGYSQSYGQQSSVDGTTAPSPHEQDPYAQSYGRRSRQSSVSSASGIDTAADQFAREFNQGSRPNSRQSGYEVSPIHPQERSRGYYDHSGYGSYYEQSSYYQDYNSYYDRQRQQGGGGRLTPGKFSIPHVNAVFGAGGQLIKVLPNRPQDGQPAHVEILDLKTVLENSPEAEDLRLYPGPLVKGDTHKNDVLLFCQRKWQECQNNISMMDRESAQLTWKYLELLIKQNGMIIGTDVADLLLEGHEPSTASLCKQGLSIRTTMCDSMVETSVEGVDRSLINPQQQLDDVTDRFRHLLLRGRKKDALEWAIKQNLWGHALFLASKMDPKTHASIMTRFANVSMKINDPLQTLYQLMSGRQPAAVTLVVDDKWGDWRPHLAMVLGNPTSRPDLDRKSVITLGDTLASKGFLHASHFCYLMAQVPFGVYSQRTSKIVLLGANHSLSFEHFSINEAIQCTEVYEYAMSLGNPLFCLHTFQSYKLIYAARLAEMGMAEEALHYCEVIASLVLPNPSLYTSLFVGQVYALASRLKYFDPQRMHNSEDMQDPDWLTALGQVVQAFQDGSLQTISGAVTPQSGSQSASEAGDHTGYQAVTDGSTVQGQHSWQYGGTHIGAQDTSNANQSWQQQQQQHQQQQQQEQQADATAQQWGQQDASGDATAAQQTWQQQQEEWERVQEQARQNGYVWNAHTQQWDVIATEALQQDATDGTAATEATTGTTHPTAESTDGVDSSHRHRTISHSSAAKANLASSINSQYTNTQTLTDSESDSDPEADSPRSKEESFDFYPSSRPKASTTSRPLPSPLPSPTPSPTPVYPRPQSLTTDPNGVLPTPSGPSPTDSELTITPTNSRQHDGPITNTAQAPSPVQTTGSVTPRTDHPHVSPTSKKPEIFQFGVPPQTSRYTPLSGPLGGHYGPQDPNKPTLAALAQQSKTGQPPPPGGDQNTSQSNDAKKGMQPPSNSAMGPKRKSWIGGFLGKFVPKGKNEMKLPDDSNPTIIWDPDKKEWINTEATEEEKTKSAPPPRDMDLMKGPGAANGMPPPGGAAHPPGPGGPPMAAQGTNRFARQKTRGARGQYVDVLGQNSAKPAQPAPSNLFSVLPNTNTQTPANIFVPQGVAGTDTVDGGQAPSASAAEASAGMQFYNPNQYNAGMPEPANDGDDQLGQLSRSSSMSSLGQEVKQYMQGPPGSEQPPAPEPSHPPPVPSGGPLMFNPAQFNAPSQMPAPTKPRTSQRRAYPR